MLRSLLALAVLSLLAAQASGRRGPGPCRKLVRSGYFLPGGAAEAVLSSGVLGLGAGGDACRQDYEEPGVEIREGGPEQDQELLESVGGEPGFIFGLCLFSEYEILCGDDESGGELDFELMVFMIEDCGGGGRCEDGGPLVAYPLRRYFARQG